MRGIILISIGLVLLAVGGCTPINYTRPSQIEYTPVLEEVKFQDLVIDKYQNLRLIRKVDGVYIDEINGGESRKVISVLAWGFFTKDGKSIAYSLSEESEEEPSGNRFYIQPVEGDESRRRQISFQEYLDFYREKLSLKQDISKQSSQ
jgi:hypothetical protein